MSLYEVHFRQRDVPVQRAAQWRRWRSGNGENLQFSCGRPPRARHQGKIGLRPGLGDQVLSFRPLPSPLSFLRNPRQNIRCRKRSAGETRGKGRSGERGTRRPTKPMENMREEGPSQFTFCSFIDRQLLPQCAPYFAQFCSVFPRERGRVKTQRARWEEEWKKTRGMQIQARITSLFIQEPHDKR